MKKQQQIYTSERGKFWSFILPKSYLNLQTFIHMHYNKKKHNMLLHVI